MIGAQFVSAEKREAELSQGPALCFHEWPQQGETVPHCQVIWQKSFLHHLMLNSSTFLRHFFSAAPQKVFRSGFLAKSVPAEA